MEDKKTYTYEEVLKASKEYFGGNDLAARVFVDKYALHNKEGDLFELTPDSMHDRLAHEFAQEDVNHGFDYQTRFDLYRNAMDKFARIVPQGSVMSAVGNSHQVISASNCVVIDSPKDDMGSIVDSGKELAQLYKRRCVEENSFVITKEKGHLYIKDVKVGMHVLSFDIKNKKNVYKKVLDKFDAFVEPEDRISIRYSNGATLNTSKKHPVLNLKEKYEYKLAGSIEIGDINLRPPIGDGCKKDLNSLSDTGWFIGTHIGDGSCGIRMQKGSNNNRYKHYRFRITGDNEKVIEGYKDVFNSIAGTKANYHISHRKDYKTKCWSFASSRRGNKEIAETLLDHQVGSKTYSAKIPSFIRKNNLWWSFIAGLIDSDGTIKENGTQIVIGLCAKDVIEETAAFLQSNGVSTHCYTRTNVRINEKPIHMICMHYSYDIWKIFSELMRHDVKVLALKEKYNREKHVFHSFKKPITNYEYNNILDKYKSFKKNNAIGNSKFRNLISANLSNLKSDKIKGLGLAGINSFVKSELFSKDKANEILQRVNVKEISDNSSYKKYVDIEVEGTNNFYCGNFGFVVVHNCGVGVDISTLRPEGAFVNNAARTTTGAWSFADFYSYITRKVGQNSRRGALMITLSVHHPDVFHFVTMKHDKTQVTGANISLKLSDEFLQAVDDNTDYELRWPVDSDNPKVSKMVRARDVWDVISKSATDHAEPGIIMWDSMVDNLPAHCYEGFRCISTNPCSEIALSAYDSCRLISINLTGYIKDPFKDNASFDFDSFSSDVRLAMQMADNLVSIELKLIDRIKGVCEPGSELELWEKLYNSGEKGRRVGLGTHGLADTLSQLCVKYDSDEALEVIDGIYKTLRDEAYTKSAELARDRGAFPVFDWEQEKDCLFIKRLPQSVQDLIIKHGRRNISLLTQAPTGSVSLLSKVGKFDAFNVSSGVEPVFRNSYIRRKKINPNDKNVRVDFVDSLGDCWEEFTVYHSNASNYFETFPDAEELPDYFVTSDQINWEKRVELQAVEQQYIDHSISSTINLPKGTSSDVVSDIYLSSWKKGLKGITVYVDGSRSGVLITESEEKLDENGRPKNIVASQSPKRLKELSTEIHHSTVKGVKWTVLVGLLGGEPYELFMGEADNFKVPTRYTEGKIVRVKKGFYNLLSVSNELLIEDILKISDSDEGAWITRMMSVALRHGVPIEYLAEQLSKDGSIVDLNNVLSRLLKKYVKKRDEKEGELCPQCGSHSIVYEEGCKKCTSCSFSGCG